MKTNRKSKGFSLMEVLVVIAIIVVIAGVVFAMGSPAKAASKRTVSLANLKQIGYSIQMYAADYDDYLPCGLDGFWASLQQQNRAPRIEKLLEVYGCSPETFHAPADPGPDPRLPAGSYFGKYGTSYLFRRDEFLTPVTLGWFDEPSAEPLVYEIEPYYQVLQPRRASRKLALYVDGSVRYPKQEEISLAVSP